MNFISKAFFIFITLLFFTKEAIALGVTPGRNIIDFEPGLKQTYDLTIVNNEHENFRALLYLEGELKEFVDLSTSEINFTEDEESKTIRYTINFPKDIKEPGTHEVKLIISEATDLGKEEVYTINVKTEIIHQIHLRVPYPGKYLKNEFFIVEKENSVDFLVTLFNLGKEDVNKVKSTFEILTPNGTHVTTLTSAEQPIKKRERRELLTRWENYSAGSYQIKAIIKYDEKQEVIEQNVSLGNFAIKLLDLFVDDFKLGSIAQFNVLVENVGNEMVNDLYSTLRLGDIDGLRVADLKSASLSISPGERQKLFLYWDTKNVAIGVYEGELALFYGENSAEKQVRTRVSENKIDVEVSGLTGAVIGSTGKKFNANFLLLGVAILIVLFIFLAMVKKRREHLKKERNN
ncbi:hypothetical protein HYT51_01095 [Candidatus Woesearchaeota archaeon]|nr:hypothetical protein [Candidatus Woesearchaeota archaeon]